jgi:copper(I)-binding protein
MNLFIPAALAAALCLSSIPLALADCATGQSFAKGDITVSGAFLRATLKGAQSAGGYLTISNAGSAPDTFTGATSQAATDIGIHSMKMNGQVMEMAPVEGGLDVPPGGAVSLDPMGYHLMLTGFGQPFVQGQCVALVLHFARAGDLPVEFNIGSIAQMRPVTGGTDLNAPGGVSVMSSGAMDMGSMEMGK